MISFKKSASSEYIEGFHRIFGDDYEYIKKIICLSQDVFEIYEDDSFCGGLCTLEFNVKNDYTIKSGVYIYGAFICENARGRGLFSKLISHVCEYYSSNFYDFVFTVPANASLFSLYEHLGFKDNLYGVVSLTDEKSEIILPQDTVFSDFDGNYNDLYFIHIQNDALLKTYDVFKQSVCDFDIKYLDCNGKRGYALYNDGSLIFASGEFVRNKCVKKGLLMKLVEFDTPSFLCDIIFEI